MSEIREKNPAIVTDSPYEEAREEVEKKVGKDTMSSTEEAINKQRRKCTISDEMINMLVTQLQAELTNFALYRTFSTYFSVKGLDKLAEYWKARAKEEGLHHDWICNYLEDCDADFSYPEIPNIKVDITSDIYPFIKTVDREIETTGGINDLTNLAANMGDWATFSFLIGTLSDAKLVPEQVNFCLEI